MAENKIKIFLILDKDAKTSYPRCKILPEEVHAALAGHPNFISHRRWHGHVGL